MFPFIPKRVKRAVRELLGCPVPPPRHTYTNHKEYQFLVSPGKGRLEGKVAAISGGTGAIGRAICAAMLAEGATVYVGGRNAEKITSITDELHQAYGAGSVRPLLFQITDEASVQDAVSRIVKECGRLDIWVNCAGASAREKTGAVVQQSMEVIDEVLNANLRSCIIGTKYAAEQMIQQGSGRIINFGSVIGLKGKAGYSDYAAAKAGIAGFGRSVAQEVGKYGITVNTVSPGGIPRAEFTDAHLDWCLKTNCMGTVGTCEQAAAAVVFLATDEAAFITGQELMVDGGRSLGLRGDA